VVDYGRPHGGGIHPSAGTWGKMNEQFMPAAASLGPNYTQGGQTVCTRYSFRGCGAAPRSFRIWGSEEFVSGAGVLLVFSL